MGVCTAGSPTDVCAEGERGATRPVLAFVHLFPLEPPKLGTPSQRRQGAAEKASADSTREWGGGGGAP